MKLGIQCFGLKNMPLPDPKAFFKRLYGMGYRLVEPCVFFGDKLPFDVWGIWTAENAVDRALELHGIGFETPSAHVFGDPEAAMDELLRIAERIGVRQYVVAPPLELTEDSCRAAAEKYRRCAEKLSAHGISLLIHNGNEQATAVKLGGRTAYEFLLDECGDSVGAQPDIGWVAAGGVDVADWMKRNEHRVRSLHYKDRADGGEKPVGKGELDSYFCFKMARYAGIPQIIDMDSCTEQDISDAAKFIQGFVNRREWTESVLCTMDTDSGEVTELKRFDGIIEAPNWSPDGKYLYYNADGLIRRYSLADGSVSKVDTGECDRCNNDHVLSADGRRIAVSHMDFAKGFSSYVYIVDMEGSEPPRLVAPNSPSFLHGWSTDGELAYCAFREEDGERVVDIYTIPEGGGEERRLTDGVGYSDGPEYSPDGKHIWFCGTRDGLMQAYRMDRDGGNLTRMTHTENNEWFPHISPDGKRVVYLTFKKGDLDPNQHLANLWVSLSVMSSDGSNVRKLVDFFGGQGTINVNSWAPDSKRIAFVKYEPKG